LATPELRDRFVELFKAVEVVGNTMVSPPASNHTCQPTAGLTWGGVSAAFKLVLDRCQRPTHSRGHGDPLEGVPLGPCLPAHVRETQKVKRLTLASAFLLASGRAVATKLDQASLLGMKIQAKLLESLSECLQAGSCIRLMLKANHEVIRITNHNALTFRMTLSPLIDPQIENVVQEHIGQ
jgi:hypothetical protein